MGGEKFGDLGDAADVFQAIVIRESEIGIESGAHVIAIEDDRGAALLVEYALGGIGDGGFSGTGEPAKPDHDAALPEQTLFVLALEKAVELGVNVGGHAA